MNKQGFRREPPPCLVSLGRGGMGKEMSGKEDRRAYLSPTGLRRRGRGRDTAPIEPARRERRGCSPVRPASARGARGVRGGVPPGERTVHRRASPPCPLPSDSAWPVARFHAATPRAGRSYYYTLYAYGVPRLCASHRWVRSRSSEPDRLKQLHYCVAS